MTVASDTHMVAGLTEVKTRFTATLRRSRPPRYRVGDEVSVLFDPADPGGARVETFAGLWLGITLVTLGGGLTSLVALFILWLARNGS